MRKKKVFAIVLTMVLMMSQVSVAKSNSVGYGKKTVTINNQKKTVNVVTVDLNNTNIQLGVTIANDKIGGHEDFSNMIKRKKPIAAINANYFDAYKTLEPMGAIMIDNKFQYLEGSPASMIVTDDGKVQIGQYNMGINGYINGFRENNWNNETQSMDYNLFKIWYVNNVPKDSTGAYIYTPARGSKIDLNGGIAIEVIKDKVTKVTKNAKQASIPKNGYVIYYGNTKSFENYVDQRFKVGDKIELEYEILEAKENAQKKQEELKEIKQNNIKSIISAGPYLVENGKSIYDPNKNGFKEDKITKNRGQRSAIGITKNNKLLLVTGSNLNMKELSQIMVKLGADRAMNLDGGASSALYANGKTITPAGRKLHTVLMVYE
ncbi:MAG: NAGPA domain-containing protein [Sporanaerobacter sp.]|jgi:exopolysaccharide biosynthesis protein|uniref:phosphodiester glycosidase family protein n=1 Tax=Sporanaerobacter sp. TaxID=2010183 RepID=UPI003A101FAB